MAEGILYSRQSGSRCESFIQGIREKAPDLGFRVRDVFDLGQMYREQGVDVAEEFRAYSILLCNFDRSYRSMRSNPRRAAVLLQPKQIVVMAGPNGITVDYLPFPSSFITDALPEDRAFASSLSESCQRIVQLIRSCL
jgi:hypothetical protein